MTRTLSWIGQHVVLVALAVLFLGPVLLVVLTSLMSNEQALTASLIPTTWEWSNYVTVFTDVPLLRWFGNSAMYAVLATLFMLVSSVPAAYVLARVRFRGANIVFLAVIVAMLLPPQVTAIPLYVMWSQAHLT